MYFLKGNFAVVNFQGFEVQYFREKHSSVFEV